jgi:hypothetical protein
MKTIFLSIIIILYGCDGAYKDEDKLIQKAYQDGFKEGKKWSDEIVDSIPVTDKDLRNWAAKLIVDSIEFRYDSIMVIHYNQSEVK